LLNHLKTWLVSNLGNKKSATKVAEQYANEYYRDLIQSQTHLIVQLEAKIAAYEAQKSNNVHAEIHELFVKQTEKGLHKYSAGVVRAENLTSVEWCQHALEEYADSMVYLMALKKQLEESEANGFKTS